MPYSIVKVVNGNYAIHAECDTLKQAKVGFHQLCAALWNDKAPLVARVQIIDQSLSPIDSEEITLSAETAEA
jgi:hypothetical protein